MDVQARVGVAAYQSASVGSAGPVRIVVMLYEGALQFIRQAQADYDDVALRGHRLGRAHRIISELLAALDYEQGGPIAENLGALYHFLLAELTRANRDGDRAALAPVLEVLQTLLEGWRGVEREGRG